MDALGRLVLAGHDPAGRRLPGVILGDGLFVEAAAGADRGLVISGSDYGGIR